MHQPELYSFFFILLSFLLPVCRSLECSNPPETITVDQSGKNGGFTTIQSAINSIPIQNTKEKVNIPQNKPCIFLEGTGSSSTIIQWSDHRQMYTTPTFSFVADDIVVKGISFVNTYNRPPSSSLAMNNTPALAADVAGDKIAFYKCTFKRVQDTLWDNNGRHCFYNCYIQGGVDFIFGNGQSIYKKSIIYFSMEDDGLQNSSGFITAQARESMDQPTGFVIKQCQITENVKGQVYLGRAYKPFARVIIANSYLSDVIEPMGWQAWAGVGHEGNITFVEEGNMGPRADTSKRVPWLKHMGSEEMNQFLDISEYIDQEGWISKLPFCGLLGQTSLRNLCKHLPVH